jgi:site-specific DNA recombinase
LLTGERIRDKIAASKKKGMWMGGLPPLGYDVRERKLVVNQDEARTVRQIYARYTELGSVRLLQRELETQGIVSKVRTGRGERRYGGQTLARGALYLMLQNRIYLGEIVHKCQSYPGQHQATIDPEMAAGAATPRAQPGRTEDQPWRDGAQPAHGPSL